MRTEYTSYDDVIGLSESRWEHRFLCSFETDLPSSSCREWRTPVVMMSSVCVHVWDEMIYWRQLRWRQRFMCSSSCCKWRTPLM